MPAIIDPLSTLALPRNQRDRLRRAIGKVRKDLPAGLVVSVSVDGFEIHPRTDSEPTASGQPSDEWIEAALDTITRELRR